MSLSRKDHEREALAYKAYAATKRTDATPSRTFVNSAMRVQLKPSYMGSSRIEANDHLMYARRDSGAQITRVG